MIVLMTPPLPYAKLSTSLNEQELKREHASANTPSMSDIFDEKGCTGQY